MHPLDLFANVLLCVVYLAVCLLVSLAKFDNSKTPRSSGAIILRSALVLSMVPTLGHPAIAAIIGGWGGAFLFALPLVPLYSALCIKNTGNRVFYSLATALPALYFLECCRLTVLSELYPANLFSYGTEYLY